MNEEVLATNNIEEIVEKTTSAIENKVNQLQFHNRAERRAFAKKLGKAGRAQFSSISETAKKLNYIDLIQKLRKLNNEKENNNNENLVKDCWYISC